MNHQQGDLIYTQIDNQFNVSKILRIDKFLQTYHCCGYQPLDQKPEINDIANLKISIDHFPLAGFPDGIFLSNQAVHCDELDGYLHYLTMTDFAGYLQLTKQDSAKVIALANELYTKAYYLSDEKKYEEAIELYTQAFETFPLFFEAIDNRAFTKMDLGRWQSALNDFRLSLYINPRSVLAEFSIGECFLNMKEYESAKAQFERALQIDPNDRLSNEFLAKTLALMNT